MATDNIDDRTTTIKEIITPVIEAAGLANGMSKADLGQMSAVQLAALVKSTESNHEIWRCAYAFAVVNESAGIARGDDAAVRRLIAHKQMADAAETKSEELGRLNKNLKQKRAFLAARVSQHNTVDRIPSITHRQSVQATQKDSTEPVRALCYDVQSARVDANTISADIVAAFTEYWKQQVQALQRQEKHLEAELSQLRSQLEVGQRTVGLTSVDPHLSVDQLKLKTKRSKSVKMKAPAINAVVAMTNQRNVPTAQLGQEHARQTADEFEQEQKKNDRNFRQLMDKVFSLDVPAPVLEVKIVEERTDLPQYFIIIIIIIIKIVEERTDLPQYFIPSPPPVFHSLAPTALHHHACHSISFPRPHSISFP